MCFCECSSWLFFSRLRSVRSRLNQAGFPSPVWPTLVRVTPSLRGRPSFRSLSGRRRRGKRWRIVPDDLRPTLQRRCKQANTAGPCSSRAGVLRSEAASAARRPSPLLLSWLRLVGSELRLRGAPQPRIVGSPARRRRQPKLLGLTVAGSHPGVLLFVVHSAVFVCYEPPWSDERPRRVHVSRSVGLRCIIHADVRVFRSMLCGIGGVHRSRRRARQHATLLHAAGLPHSQGRGCRRAGPRACRRGRLHRPQQRWPNPWQEERSASVGRQHQVSQIWRAARP